MGGRPRLGWVRRGEVRGLGSVVVAWLGWEGGGGGEGGVSILDARVAGTWYWDVKRRMF